MKKRAVFFCCALLAAAVIFSGCTGSQPIPAPTPTPAPQIVYVTIVVTPAETTAAQIPLVTPAADSPIGKRWKYRYEFGDRDNPRSYYRNESMVFTMDRDGTTNGTITSESGASATITGEWYRDQSSELYYITPVLCMSLDTDWGEVLTPAGERVKWDSNAPDIPGRNNPYHWCEDQGVMYAMRYMQPKKLVQMRDPDKPEPGGITFTAD